jgi:hypothetical protein
MLKWSFRGAGRRPCFKVCAIMSRHMYVRAFMCCVCRYSHSICKYVSCMCRYAQAYAGMWHYVYYVQVFAGITRQLIKHQKYLSIKCMNVQLLHVFCLYLVGICMYMMLYTPKQQPWVHNLSSEPEALNLTFFPAVLGFRHLF